MIMKESSPPDTKMVLHLEKATEVTGLVWRIKLAVSAISVGLDFEGCHLFAVFYERGKVNVKHMCHLPTQVSDERNILLGMEQIGLS